MQTTIDDEDWEFLLERIKDGKCTPFLGAGACYGSLPLGGEVAQQWAEKYDYPLEDSWDLGRVAQYLAVQRYPMFPKERLLREFTTTLAQKGAPNFQEVDEPPRIQRAMTGASLVFIGYGLREWTFRVLYRGLVAPMEQALR